MTAPIMSAPGVSDGWFETIGAADLGEAALRTLVAERLAIRQVLHLVGAGLAGEALGHPHYLQADEDGESLFLTAADVAYHAARLDPGLGARLFTLPVRFEGGAEAAAPILLDVGGRLQVNWNGRRAAPGQGEEAATLGDDFRRFLERLVEAGVARRIRLAAGDAVVFRGAEVLHARAA